MGRIAIALAVLLAVLWQSGDLARSTVTDLADLEHAALHWHEQGHHHHEDGSVHLDDSNDSVLHALSDPVTTTAALPTPPLHDLVVLASAAPGGMRQPAVPDPTLDGLLRPPRPRS